MQILSHRGYWQAPAEKNAEVAFLRSFELGFGTETDIRDFVGQVVMSHDPPHEMPLGLEAFLALYGKFSPTLPLALNVKSDGLQPGVMELLRGRDISNLFFFDMSVPDAVAYIRHGLPIFTRQSEFESHPVLYDEAKGVWMDSFQTEWISDAAVMPHLDAGKKICIVSAELHKRDHRPQWDQLARMQAAREANVMLCTDIPEKAREFFNVQN